MVRSTDFLRYLDVYWGVSVNRKSSYCTLLAQSVIEYTYSSGINTKQRIMPC